MDWDEDDCDDLTFDEILAILEDYLVEDMINNEVEELDFND
jgi:hypothetical protein